MVTRPRLLAAVLGIVALVATGCSAETGDAASGIPEIVVTTNVLGDVVGAMFDGAADVVTVMPVGTDPHDFQASARQAQTMRSAQVLVTNGAGLEEGLDPVVRGAASDGVDVYAAIDAVDTIPLRDGGRVDPHFFTDPARMAVAARGIADHVFSVVPVLDTPEGRARVDSYIGKLRQLDADAAETLDAVPADRRILVTNHRAFGYFADRYDFQLAGVIVPGGSTTEGVSGADLAALADVVRSTGVAAIFADASSSRRVADALAGEVGDVTVVELYSESLGATGSDGATYLDMIRTDARRIAEALAP